MTGDGMNRDDQSRDDQSRDDHDRDVHGLDELLGAYALDAVDENERARVEDYLRINPRAAAEVADHREVATMLAYTGMNAPDVVWERIESELDASDLVPAPGPELAKIISFDPERDDKPSSRRWSRSGPWLAGVAAALAIAVVAVAVIDRSPGNDGDPVQTAFDAASSDEGSRSAELVAEGSAVAVIGVVDADGTGFVDAGDLPALGPDQTYQLWSVLAATGDVVSVGILGPEPDLETFTVAGEVAALAITIEQGPGVVSDGNPDGAYVGELA